MIFFNLDIYPQNKNCAIVLHFVLIAYNFFMYSSWSVAADCGGLTQQAVKDDSSLENLIRPFLHGNEVSD